MQRGSIEVWTARPDVVGGQACDTLAALLDAGERGRAAQFRFDADRRAFVLAHAMRRMALGSALGADPAELRFGATPQGKPVLLDADDAPAFSLSRTRGFAACAVGRVPRLGVDAERVRDDVPASVLDQFLLPVPGEEDADLFLQWTALEAYWKAQGSGLSANQPRIGLRAFAGDECYEVLDGLSQQALGMVVLRLPAPPGYALAVATDELGDVRMVQLDGLASRAAFDGAQAAHAPLHEEGPFVHAP